MLKGRRIRWVLIALGILLLIGGLVLLTEPRRKEDVATKDTSKPGGHADQSGDPGAGSSDTPGDTAQAYAMVSRARQQLIGVTTAVLEPRPLETTVRAVGRVEYNEERIAHVNLRISGWVEDLFIDYTGQLVRKGQPLFTLYSPDLVATQDEFLLALKARNKVKDSPVPEVHKQAEELVEASRDRLHLWTLTDQQIQEIARRGKANTYLTIYSPATGYVIDKKVFKGMFVQPETRRNEVMAFVRGGGLFVPTAKRYNLGDEVFILLSLMDDKDRLPVAGKVVWITPAGAQGSRTAGIGVQFNETADGEAAKTKIEALLAGTLGAERLTHTM